MTVQGVLQRIKAIEEAAGDGDDERAHGLRDALYVDVLTAVANGERPARKLAAAALLGEVVPFAKWCA